MERFAMLEALLKVYPEFKELAQTEEQIAQWEVYFHKAQCLIPNFAKVNNDNYNTNCRFALPLFMVVAHLFVMDGLAQSIGINASSGSVASSSVGDVSIGFNSAPYTLGKSPNFNYWWGLTKYGAEYLAWLDTQSGLRYVNY